MAVIHHSTGAMTFAHSEGSEGSDPGEPIPNSDFVTEPGRVILVHRSHNFDRLDRDDVLLLIRFLIEAARALDRRSDNE